MKFFKWHIIIIPEVIPVEGYIGIQPKFAKIYCNKTFTRNMYLNDRITSIKQLQNVHKEVFGCFSEVKATKEFLDEYYDYNETMGLNHD